MQDTGTDVATGRSTAASSDGRTFTFTVTGVDPAPRAGDLFALEPGGGLTTVGQVLRVETGSAGSVATGDGVVIGTLEADGTFQRGSGRPFPSASLRPVTASQLETLQHSSGADLAIGSWVSAGISVPARLRSQGFGRHTFLCGQSGSGKTYALGVILEQLMLGTELRMIVLDPNADFVKLGEIRSDAPDEARRLLAQQEIRVLSADGHVSGEALLARFATMPRPAQAAVMQMNPIADRGEYNAYLHKLAGLGPVDITDVVASLAQGSGEERALGQRIENLGLLHWQVWAAGRPSAADVVKESRLTVMDLSGFGEPQEPYAVGLDLVEELWAQRRDRTPTLIVIDEAHNLCPAEPQGPMQSMIVDRLIQIAAEGRKYGLWLFLSSQRPSKIHPQVLSQCDNLVLMRMNSPGDVQQLSTMFGFAPPALLEASTFFEQGEALVAGSFVPRPALIRMGRRLTEEGGSDVRVPVNGR
jgi:hypothetical protein